MRAARRLRRILGATLFWLASPSLAGEPSSAECGLSLLASELARAVAARFPEVEGRLVAVAGSRTFFDVPDLAPGTELDWLAPAGDLLEPVDLTRVGTLLRRCGRIRVAGSNHSISFGDLEPLPGCPSPSPGDTVRQPSAALRLGIAPGQAEPALAGLLEVIVAVLPERLGQTGRFDPSRWPTPTSSLLGATPEETERQLAKRGLDALVRVSVAVRAGRIQALAEVIARTPRPLRDLALVETPSVPEAFFRPRGERPLAVRERAHAALSGTVLDLAIRAREDGTERVVVLSDMALAEARLDADGELRLETLVRFAELPPAPQTSRVTAGSLVVEDGDGGTALCFATTELASGWCWRDGELEPVDGVPLAGPSGTVLGRYRPGTDILDGELRWRSNERRVDIGPFLALDRDGAAGAVVYRADATLEWLGPELRPTAERHGPCGDGWAVGPAGVLCSGARPRGQPDSIEAGTLRVAVAGSIVALARADLDGDGQADVVAATSDGLGASNLALFTLP